MAYCSAASRFKSSRATFAPALAKTFANVQNSGMLTDYVNIIKRIAVEKDVPVCDIYKSWIAMNEAGVDVTELLANKFNHPIRELHYYIAMKIVEQIFSV